MTKEVGFDQAASLLGVSRNDLENLLAANTIPFTGSFSDLDSIQIEIDDLKNFDIS